MTTNSHNPVDGDVQALIEHINEVLQEYEEHGGIGYGEAVYRTALSALTAEPVGNFYEDGKDNWWQLGPHDKTPHITPLYTTPPAQLLRQVELPDCVDDLHGVGPVMSADAVVQALHQQGYEVKS